MANEIEIRCSLKVSKGAILKEMVSGLIRATMTGDMAPWLEQSVGTSEEALFIPTDVGTPGWILIINTDATNYVSVRRATGEGNFGKMLAGEPMLLRLEATAPYVIANTGACVIKYLLIEL